MLATHTKRTKFKVELGKGGRLRGKKELNKVTEECLLIKSILKLNYVS